MLIDHSIFARREKFVENIAHNTRQSVVTRDNVAISFASPENWPQTCTILFTSSWIFVFGFLRSQSAVGPYNQAVL